MSVSEASGKRDVEEEGKTSMKSRSYGRDTPSCTSEHGQETVEPECDAAMGRCTVLKSRQKVGKAVHLRSPADVREGGDSMNWEKGKKGRRKGGSMNREKEKGQPT